MSNINEIIELLSNMTEDTNSNIKKIKKVFGSLKYTDDENQSLLHIFVDRRYEHEEKCFLAIQSLLKAGLSPNLEADFNYNFIQTALYAGYSEGFILNIIQESLKYNLDVNHVDDDGDTIVYTAIYSDDYFGKIDKIYELLCSNGYDSSKMDNAGRNLIEAMKYETKFSKSEIDIFEQLFYDNLNKKNNSNNISNKVEKPIQVIQTLSEKEISELEKFGKVLNKKNYTIAPTIGREKELKNLMVSLALSKKRPLIIGKSGVGKTALLEELVYRIKTEQVPRFLQGKIILEVNPGEIVAGCKFVGSFEKNMVELMQLCGKYDVIIFIDEIHTVYGIGSSEGKSYDMAAMLKYYIDRTNVKVIGTTTQEEYDKFFSSDALKRRFEIIKVEEPTREVLYQIIDKVISDYSLETGILFENDDIKSQIIKIILDSTGNNHRVYFDKVNNPDLSISIVDKAFAFAKVYDSEFITIEDFIESFEYNDRIYETTRKQAISELKLLRLEFFKPTSMILQKNHNKH